MTEAQWRRCADPVPMLSFIHGLASGRKLRLFAVACARRVAHVLPDDRVRRALDAAERLADGLLDPGEWADVEAAVKAVRAGIDPLADAARWDALTAAVIAVSHAARPEDELRLATNAAAAAAVAARRAAHNSSAADGEVAAQAVLVREVFGDPVRPVRFSPAWRTSTVLTLAAQMYSSGDFSALPILADALQDADCNSEKILNHCRDTRLCHMKGCWVVDLLLGKQ